MAVNVPWDDRLAQQARVSDLSPALMPDYLREVRSALADDATSMSLEASRGRFCGPELVRPEAVMRRPVSLTLC